jgi:outer membrane receptor for ferrienterochelin and colicins
MGLVGFQGDLKQHQDRVEGAQIIAVDEITPGADRQNIEAYIQNDIFLGDWELLPGLRFQDDSDFGGYSAPKINLMMSPNWWPKLETRLRVGVGRGYRVPNLKERFFIFDHSGLGYMVLGNPDLTPEKSDSLQAGIEISRGNGFRAEFSVFHNDIKNLIDSDLDPEQSAALGLNIFKYVNIAKARTQGADLILDHRFSARFSGNLGYSYLDAIDRATGNDLTERPEHQVKLGVDWRFPKWGTEISLRGSYQSKEFVDGTNLIVSPQWTTFDLKFNQPYQDHLTFFIGIDNVTDEHRDPERGGEDFRPKKGRFIYAGVRLTG